MISSDLLTELDPVVRDMKNSEGWPVILSPGPYESLFVPKIRVYFQGTKDPESGALKYTQPGAEGPREFTFSSIYDFGRMCTEFYSGHTLSGKIANLYVFEVPALLHDHPDGEPDQIKLELLEPFSDVDSASVTLFYSTQNNPEI